MTNLQILADMGINYDRLTDAERGAVRYAVDLIESVQVDGPDAGEDSYPTSGNVDGATLRALGLLEAPAAAKAEVTWVVCYHRFTGDVMPKAWTYTTGQDMGAGDVAESFLAYHVQTFGMETEVKILSIAPRYVEGE